MTASGGADADELLAVAAAAVGLAVFGLGMTVVLDIFHLQPFALVTLIILGGITIYRLRKQ